MLTKVEIHQLLDVVRDYCDLVDQQMNDPVPGDHYADYIWGDAAAEAIASLESVIVGRPV